MQTIELPRLCTTRQLSDSLAALPQSDKHVLLHFHDGTPKPLEFDPDGQKRMLRTLLDTGAAIVYSDYRERLAAALRLTQQSICSGARRATISTSVPWLLWTHRVCLRS